MFVYTAGWREAGELAQSVLLCAFSVYLHLLYCSLVMIPSNLPANVQNLHLKQKFLR